tara:strand:- start:5794 stop:6693 length:900 start_codon:yes stop_codon:yes gene_type:complete
MVATATKSRTKLCLISLFIFTLVGSVGSDNIRAQTNSGKITFSTGIDFSTAYLFRGIKQERTGIIAQPFVDASFKIYSDTDGQGLQNFSLSIGQWNSLHSGQTGSSGPSQNVGIWYESDFFTGVSLDIDNWEASITYTSYMSPNDTFGTTQELSLGLNMDDSVFLGNFSLNPHVLMAIEVSGGADNGSSEGVYLEFGVTPGTHLLNDRIIVQFPVSLGLSLINYYENGVPKDSIGYLNNRYGFFSAGTIVTVPVPISKNFGEWELAGGVHFFSLGKYLETLNDNNGTQVVGLFGVNIGY